MLTSFLWSFLCFLVFIDMFFPTLSVIYFLFSCAFIPSSASFFFVFDINGLVQEISFLHFYFLYFLYSFAIFIISSILKNSLVFTFIVSSILLFVVYFGRKPIPYSYSNPILYPIPSSISDPWVYPGGRASAVYIKRRHNAINSIFSISGVLSDALCSRVP